MLNDYIGVICGENHLQKIITGPLNGIFHGYVTMTPGHNTVPNMTFNK